MHSAEGTRGLTDEGIGLPGMRNDEGLGMRTELEHRFQDLQGQSLQPLGLLATGWITVEVEPWWSQHEDRVEPDDRSYVAVSHAECPLHMTVLPEVEEWFLEFAEV